jgi:hypothetical protein
MLNLRDEFARAREALTAYAKGDAAEPPQSPRDTLATIRSGETNDVSS